MDGIPDSMDMSLSKLQEMVKDRKLAVLQSMGPKMLLEGKRMDLGGRTPKMSIAGLAAPTSSILLVIGFHHHLLCFPEKHMSRQD